MEADFRGARGARRIAGLFLALALTAPAALAQDEGDVMQIFERAERQVKQLNDTSSLAQRQMAATRRAVDDFAAASAGSASDVEAATRQALAEFRKTENALENLSRVLGDLSESLGGLDSIRDSLEGARQIDALDAAIGNADRVFSALAEGEGAEAMQARLSQQQFNLVRSQLERQDEKRAEAARMRAGEGGGSNIERLAQVLARLSVMAEIAEIRNSVNRDLMLALAMRAAPDAEKRERLTAIVGDFGVPADMVGKVEALADAMTEATATLIEGLFRDGGGFPDFTEAEVADALGMLNRAREMTCEECTDGIDNDLDGLVDAEQGGSCRMFTELDPHCEMANANP